MKAMVIVVYFQRQKVTREKEKKKLKRNTRHKAFFNIFKIIQPRIFKICKEIFNNPANIYLFIVNNRNTRKMC